MHHWTVTIAALSLALMSGPADACRMHAPLDLSDVRTADVVLIGRISHYRIIRDSEFRPKRMANPERPPNLRKIYEGPTGLMSDYARCDIKVDRVLAGKAPTRLSVTWDNSTFGEPEKMGVGPFLIALRKPGSKMPPLHGPSATILPNRDPGSLTLLQAPCSRPFLFESISDEARAVALILSGRSH